MGKNVTSTHWCLGSALGAPQKKLVCLFLEHLQGCVATVATALGPDILKYVIQSRTPQRQVTEFGGGCAVHCSGPPALRVAGLVTPSQASCGRAAVACSFPFAFLRTGWRQRGGFSSARECLSACQEEPLTHRRCFPVRREKWLYHNSLGKDRRKLVHQSILCLPKIQVCY